MSVLYSKEVLKVNSSWAPIGFATPEKAFGDLLDYCRDRWTNEVLVDAKSRPLVKLRAIEIEFQQNPDGSYDFSTILVTREVSWAEWLSVTPRSYDLVVNTPKRPIRIPRVVVTTGYDKMPKSRTTFDLDTAYRIYKGVCQYTHKQLTRDEASLDHVIPLDKGGANNWGNIVLSDKEFNCWKSNRTPKEIGYPYPKSIVPPLELPVSAILKNTKQVPEWRMFLPD